MVLAVRDDVRDCTALLEVRFPLFFPLFFPLLLPPPYTLAPVAAAAAAAAVFPSDMELLADPGFNWLLLNWLLR